MCIIILERMFQRLLYLSPIVTFFEESHEPFILRELFTKGHKNTNSSNDIKGSVGFGYDQETSVLKRSS